MSIETTDVYNYRPLPWLSKSTVLGYQFCQHLFKLRYIDNITQGSNIKMETGTNMHVVYAKFFEIIDLEKLKKIPLDYIKPVDQTQVYNYMYNIVIGLIPPDSRRYDPYQIMVRNFCLIQAYYWIELNRKFSEVYSKVIKFFLPKLVEVYLECQELKIFGTIDISYLYEEDDKITIIYDNKTGRVPLEILEERGVDPSDEFSWKLQTKRSFELHWYILLDMMRRGYKIDEKIIDFCTKDEYFNDDAEFPKVKSYFYDIQGKPVKCVDLYRIGIIYTGNEKGPYVPKKKPHKKSMKAVFTWINRIRTILKNQGPFNKEPTYWKCRECNADVRDFCLTEEENKALFYETQ